MSVKRFILLLLVATAIGYVVLSVVIHSSVISRLDEPLPVSTGASPTNPQLTNNALYFSNSAGASTVSILQNSAVDSGTPAAGTGLTIQAMAGTNAYGNRNAGAGGSTWVVGGAPGVNFTDASENGAAGPVIVGYADAAVFEFATSTSAYPVTDDVYSIGTVSNRFLNVVGASITAAFDGGTGDQNSPSVFMTGLIYPSANNSDISTLVSSATLSFNAGASAISSGLGDISIIDPGGELDFASPFGVVPLVVGVGSGGYTYFGGVTYQFNPALGQNAANAAVAWSYPAQASTSSGAGAVGGASTMQFSQPGQPTTGNHAGGAGGAQVFSSPAGGSTTGTSNSGAGGAWTGNGGAGGAATNASATAGAGGAVTSNGGAGGANSASTGTGGAGGAKNELSGAGGNGGASGTGGASGAFTFGTAAGGTGSTAGNAGIFTWDLNGASFFTSGGATPTPNWAQKAVTLTGTGTTTLTASQYVDTVIVISAVTTTGNTTLAFPNSAGGPWYVVIGNITLGATDTFTVSSGTASCPTISAISTSSSIWVVITGGSNTIFCNQ